ncbi:hypothetical protein LY76DRAFT_114373 [Colletotrichum caudatum]|nr:hypothetical protein LY76DRAFT_114373 [Colletotrichum caudatum]
MEREKKRIAFFFFGRNCHKSDGISRVKASKFDNSNRAQCSAQASGKATKRNKAMFHEPRRWAHFGAGLPTSVTHTHTLWCEGVEFPFWEWQQQTCPGASEWRPTRVGQDCRHSSWFESLLDVCSNSKRKEKKEEKKVYHIHGVSFLGPTYRGFWVSREGLYIFLYRRFSLNGGGYLVYTIYMPSRSHQCPPKGRLL